MRLLLDTHVLIWLGMASNRISEPVRSALELEGTEVFVSSISVWEILSKQASGKLALPLPPQQFIETVMHDLIALPLAFESNHAKAISGLPLLHRDPFDRMLLCQAWSEGLTLVTSDEAVRKYDVPTFW